MSDALGAETGSRRALVSAAGGGAAALLIAGCSQGRSLRSQLSAEVARSDIALLNHLIDLEHLTIAAYTAGIPLMGRAEAHVAKRFLDQETEHAAGLAALVKALGAKGDAPRPSYQLGHPSSSGDVLALLHSAESAQLAAYVAAIPRLAPGSVRAAAAGYLSNDAQHVAILRGLLGQTPLAGPLVTGGE